MGQRNQDYKTARKKEGLWVIKEMERGLLKIERINNLFGTKTETTVMATDVRVSTLFYSIQLFSLLF